MALTGIAKTEVFVFYSRFDDAVGDEAKTAWHLGALPVAVRAYLGDITFLHVTGPDGSRAMQDRSATRNVEAVRFGLKNVTNYKNPAGGDIPIEFEDRVLGSEVYKVVTDLFLSTIPPVVIGELGEKILSNNTMTEEMRKKLATP